jgi:hypothetical protein
MVHANEQADAPHTLCHGFGSREAWEWEPAAGGLVNAQHRFKALGLVAERVTAAPTAQLAALEEGWELRALELRKQLDAREWEAGGRERRADDLIRAGQRAAGEGRAEADALRARLETVNGLALRWQEEATLAGDALREAQATVEALRRGGGGGDAAAAIDRLRAEHARQMERARATHAEQLQVAARRAAGGGEEAAAEDELQRLLEERTRLHAAMRCIKDMLAGQAAAEPEGEPHEQHRLALGVPVEGSLPPTPPPAGPAASPPPPPRPGSAASRASLRSGPAAAASVTFSPAPADHSVFDAALRGRIGGLYDLVNPFRPASAPGDTPGSMRTARAANDDEGDDDDIFASPLPAFSPASPGSVRRTAVGGGGGGCLVDFAGEERPGALTEGAMARILDAPGLAPPPEQDGSALLGRINRQRARAATPAASPPPARRALLGGTPSPPAAAAAGGGSLPADEAHAGWSAAGRSLLPGSEAASPAGGLPQGAEDSCEACFTPLAMSDAVRALDAASPTAAGFVAHYVADGLSMRASMPAAAGPSKGKAAGAAPRRHSAPLAPKRSTFLQRPLVADTDVYG